VHAAGEASPWGRAILPPEALNQILFVTSDRARWPSASDNYVGLPKGSSTPVGLFGGCEVKVSRQPVARTQRHPPTTQTDRLKLLQLGTLSRFHAFFMLSRSHLTARLP
jgi:hypothetical protein